MIKLINSICVLAIVAQSLTSYLVLLPPSAYAQEATPTIDQSTPPADTTTPTPTVDQTIPTDSVTPTPTDVPTDTVTPTPTDVPTPTDTPTVDNLSPPAPVSNESSSAKLVPNVWQTNPDGSATTIDNVSLNQTYIAPQNDKVTVTFTKLPDNPGKLTITEVKLTADQQKASGAYSDTAYNITSDMADGTFQYDLTLPLPSQAKGKSVQVKSSETADGLKNSNNVDKPTVANDTVTITGLNHFTIFVVVVLGPDYATPGGGGVYSAYYGPPDYNTSVSPGSTAVFDGREAGIIKAGITPDPTNHDYEDQGLFGFKVADVPITTFSTQPLTYDFENQYGANPVWVYIELNKNLPDDVIYQYVPTTNPSNWHTEDAGTGTHWLKWTDTFSGITTGSMVSLSDIATDNPGKTVSRVYLSEGIGDSYHDNPNGTVAWVDKVTIGDTEYDFSITSVTTNAATSVTSSDATLNGFNKSDATGHSFWVSTSTFSTASSTIPSGVYSTPDLGAISANAPFSASLSSITTTGVPSNLPAITPGTQYYFAAWSLVNGTWYPGEVKTFTTNPGPVFIDTNVNGVFDPGESSFDTIQQAVNAAVAGNTIHVTAGTYTEVGQIVINKNLSIVGDDKATTIIKPAQDTDSSGDGRGWFLTVPGITFNMSGVTLDGVGKNIFVGIYDYSLGTIQDINIKNIGFTTYEGRAIYLKNNATVRNVRFENIERIGVFVFLGATAAIIDGNTYVGKGTGDHLDYGIELSGGGIATITNNTVSGNTGVASSDGSTSAGILVTTYFGPGTTATITGNTLTDNTDGIAVGYDASDTSVVVAHNNNLSGNTGHGVTSTAPTVNATNNWWGNASGPKDNKSLPGSPNYNNPSGAGNPVTSYVEYEPWCTNLACTTFSSANPTTNPANAVTTTGATVNGTNGDFDASNTSFWWGTTSAGPFTAAVDPSSQVPPGWTHHPTGTGAKLAGSPFNYDLTGLTPVLNIIL